MRKSGSDPKIIDEIFHHFFDEINNLQSIGEKSKAFNIFLDKLLENSLGLMHCLWSESLLKELVENGIKDIDYIDSVFDSEMHKRRKIFIERFKKLRKSFVKKPPSDRVQTHLTEASKCFLYGFDQAAIALCRATLDFVLRDGLGVGDEYMQLSDLIRNAKENGFISNSEIYKSAWEIKKIADDVMHVRPFKFDALQVINKTRIVFEDILRTI